MLSKIKIQEWVLYCYLVFNTFIITILPGSAFLFSGVYYVQMSLFAIFLMLSLDFNVLLEYKLPFDQFRYKVLFLFFLIFIFSVFVMNFGNNGDFKSISKIITYFISFYLFFLYLPGMFKNDKDKFEAFLNIILGFAVVNSFIGLLLLYSGITPNTLYTGFFTGLFGHPNTAGIVYCISIPVLMYKLFVKKINIWLFLALLILFSFCLLSSYSRSAYFAVAFSVFILAMYKSKKIFILTLILFSISLLTVVVDFFATKGGMSSVSRLLLYYTAYDMITTNMNSFLWGYGVFRSLEIFFVEKLFFGSLEIVVDPHNFILLLGIQFGMVVTLSFIIFSFWIMIASTRKRKSLDDISKNMLSLSLSICLGFLVQNMFEDIMVYPEYFAFPVYLIFLGLMFSSIGKNKQ